MVSIFANDGSPWPTLWRPLVVAICVVLLVQGLLWVVSRRPGVAALATLLATLASMSYIVLALALFIVVDGWLVIARRRRQPTAGIAWNGLNKILNMIAGIVILLAGASVVSSGPYWPTAPHPPGPATQDLPDIYLILADGHPRLDTMRTDFAIDTTAFEHEMAIRGFVESPRAQSNYNFTALTLASMVHGRQVDELVSERPVEHSARFVSALINSPSLIDTFRAKGYEIVSVPSSYTPVSPDECRSLPG